MIDTQAISTIKEEMSRLYKSLGMEYLNDNTAIPPEYLHAAPYWLAARISVILKQAGTEGIDRVSAEIVEQIRESVYADELFRAVNLQGAYRDACIRLDFAKAFEKVNNGYALSAPLGYSFSKEDLRVLADLHKKGQFREKIEELLEDCNFHIECHLLAGQRYDEMHELLEAEENIRE